MGLVVEVSLASIEQFDKSEIIFDNENFVLVALKFVHKDPNECTSN